MALPRGNHYAVLGVQPDASLERLEKAYRHLMELYSEDSLATYSLLSPEEVRQACAQVRQAYAVLRDPVKRLEYDARHGFISRTGSGGIEEPPPEREDRAADGAAAGVVESPPTALPQTRPKEEPTVLPDPVTGEALKHFREQRGISLREVSEISKVGLRYLEYIERDRHSALPAAVYIRGFVQEYSRVVGLDPRKTAEAYLARVDDESDI